jgi:hypothetical protein
MTNVYIVKSFGPNGYVNLKAFADHGDALKYRAVIRKQIPLGVSVEDEFVEIEELSVE